MVYCNISAILVAIIKLKYLKKKQILDVRTLLSTHLSNILIDHIYAYIHKPLCFNQRITYLFIVVLCI
jgi:hypothetical protein